MKTVKYIILFVFSAVYFSCSAFSEEQRAEAQVLLASAVLEEINKAPDRSMPKQFFNKSVAIGIFPNLKKGGYIVGGLFGRGIVVYKKSGKENFSYPAFFKIHGGSLGLQAGIQEIDLILFFLTENSFNNFLKNYVNVGFNLTASAGPVGRDLQINPADYHMKPEESVYAYSRSKGLFAGISVGGLKLTYDFEWTKEYYHDAYSEQMIFTGDEIQNAPKSSLSLLRVIKKIQQEE